jgi:hypothetical protein
MTLKMEHGNFLVMTSLKTSRVSQKIVGLNEIIDKDPTLKELADMEPGQVATRKFKGDIWIIKRVE